MKKLMFAAALMAAGAAMAVESGIVGYNTTPILKGYNIFALNFKNCGATTEIDIQTLFKGTGNLSTTPFKAGTMDTGDKIMVYVNDGKGGGDYANYYLYDTTQTKTMYTKKRGFWVDNTGAKSSKKFKNGDSIWFLRRGDDTVNLQTSGEVELCSVTNVQIKTGFNMIGSFFPDGWKLNDDYYTQSYWQKSGAKAGTMDTGDKIMVYVNDGKGGGDYANYYLYDTTQTKSMYTKKKYKWVNNTGTVVTDAVMPAGKGAWYLHRGSGFTLEIKNQFK